MTEYLAPGVYLEEASFRAKSIEGVPTTPPQYRERGSDREWKYVHLRRYLLFLEHSIDTGTQWAVFESNDEKLWADIRRTISDFLADQWHQGSLMGSTANSAYLVKCDRSTMTQIDLDNGLVIAEVGVALEAPNFFSTFRLAHPTAECPRLRREPAALRFELSAEGRPIGYFEVVNGLQDENKDTVTLSRGETSFEVLREWVGKGSADSGVVAIVDHAGEGATWVFRGARPIKWVGPSLDPEGTDVAIEELELTYESIAIA